MIHRIISAVIDHVNEICMEALKNCVRRASKDLIHY